MKKKMLKNIAKAAVFVFVFLAGIITVSNTLNFKYLDSVFKVKMFYEQEDNTVDVLVLGSSHAYQGINTAVLWREFGIAAYDLCGAAQPIWNTYYYLEEALKTQTPKVILLDLYTIHYSNDYSEESFAIKNTYGLKWSDTKTAAIRNSFDTSKSKMQFYFPILQYHSRYSDLDKSDFYPYIANEAMYKNHKGFYCYYYATEIKNPNLVDVEYKNPLSEKNEKYLRMILELAGEKNIPVVLTALPFAGEPYHEAFFNSAKDIAAEYGCEFYDFLNEYADAVDIDYATDFSDGQHLNCFGGEKITRFFGKIFSDKYSVPDRRGDEKYQSWEDDANVYYRQKFNHDVTKFENIDSYADILSKDRYKIIITAATEASGDMTLNMIHKMMPLFTAAGIEIKEYSKGGVWIIENGEVVYYNNGRYPGFGKSVSLGKFDDAYISSEEVEVDDNKSYIKLKLSVNGEDKTVVSKGVNIYIYDTFIQSTVDIAGFDFADGEFRHGK